MTDTTMIEAESKVMDEIFTGYAQGYFYKVG
jgi:hypothetical protein